jgi:acetyl esterase/lipase
MGETVDMTRRFGLAAIGASLTAACSPLSLFANLSPKDPALTSARDVAFGPDPRQRLDVYAPPKPRGEARGAPAPVAVFFYGGSWDSGRRQDYNWIGRALAARGFVTVIADYRLYPAARFPAFLEDGALAVRWAVDHAGQFGGDPGRVVLIGHSAGAYNAAMLALDSRYLTAAGVDPRRIRAFAGLSGPYDFLPLTDPIAIRTFGEAQDLPATQPTAFARSDAPAAFLATGEKDTYVFPRNTVALAKALRSVGAPVEERHYPELTHISMVLSLSRPLRGRATVFDEMVAFLKARSG